MDKQELQRIVQDMDVQYEFFMCQNLTVLSMAVDIKPFLARPTEIVGTLKRKISTPRAEKEVLIDSLILGELQKQRIVNVAQDEELMQAWLAAVEGMRRGWMKDWSLGVHRRVAEDRERYPAPWPQER